jgi:hypothetical protein
MVLISHGVIPVFSTIVLLVGSDRAIRTAPAGAVSFAFHFVSGHSQHYVLLYC